MEPNVSIAYVLYLFPYIILSSMS